MKRNLCKILFFFISINIFSQQKFSFLEISNNSDIQISHGGIKLYKNYSDYKQLFYFETSSVIYLGEKISLQIAYVIKPDKTNLLSELINAKKINVEAISNITDISKKWQNSHTFIERDELTIKEYVRDIGNGRISDDFGFLIKINDKNNVIDMIDIRFINVYSTLVESGGYESPWNKQRVITYSDQQNKGINFYYSVEELIKTISLNNHEINVIGTVNDEKVRFRKDGNLNSPVIRFFDEKEIVDVISCIVSQDTKDKNSYPWIKVKVNNGEIGFIYGEFLDISIAIE